MANYGHPNEQMQSNRGQSDAREDRVLEGAVAASDLNGSFPLLHLPICPPFAPMEAKSVNTIPEDADWEYEPKWDGFRCIAFREGSQLALQSKAGQPLTRYFPELVAGLLRIPAQRFVLDGEIVVVRDERLSFDDLLMRIHPAKSRIDKLSRLTPCTFMLFDLLLDEDGALLLDRPLHERRTRLKQFHARVKANSLLSLSPATRDVQQAKQWLQEIGAGGLDGIVAKRIDSPYASGKRTMYKFKRVRTAECVVGGFRWANKGRVVGSLLLGLYDDDGLLHHVGFTSSFNQRQRAELVNVLEPYRGGSGFTGNAPGGPSRWSTERSSQWERLDPQLVAEVSYDHFSGERFRHGTKFLHWRPEKRAKSCTFAQVRLPSADLDNLWEPANL